MGSNSKLVVNLSLVMGVHSGPFLVQFADWVGSQGGLNYGEVVEKERE